MEVPAAVLKTFYDFCAGSVLRTFCIIRTMGRIRAGSLSFTPGPVFKVAAGTNFDLAMFRLDQTGDASRMSETRLAPVSCKEVIGFYLFLRR